MARIILAFASIALILSVACGGGDDKKDGGILGGATSNSSTSGTPGASTGSGSSSSGSSGSGSGSSSSNSKDPVQFAQGAMVTIFGVLSGSNDPQQMLDLYAPECRTGVKTSDITQVLTLVRAFFPELSKLKIQEVDLSQANPKVEKSGNTSKVTLGDPNKVRLKVDGQFQPVGEVSKKLGFPDLDDSPLNVADEPLTVKEVDGKLYISDCSSLKDIASP